VLLNPRDRAFDGVDVGRQYLGGGARAETQVEAEDLIVEIRSDMDTKLRDLRAEFDRICAHAGSDDERDPTTRLN
jgi:hypothetical protein